MEPIEIRSAGGQKQAFHFGAPGRPLLGFYHPPPEGTAWRGAGVVLSSPIGTDHTRSDLTYRHLAERLARAGFPCLRFDLTATGDSGGEEGAPGLVKAWIEDVGLAAQELRARSGIETVALVGLRLGATLAMVHAAERSDVDALVLFSPCVSGAAYVEEVTKLHKLYTRIEPHIASAPPPKADGEEALGLFLTRSLVQELSQLDLLQTARRPARRALVIEGGKLPARDALMTRLRELGVDAELRTFPMQKFLVTVSHRQTVPADVLDSIALWLEQTYPSASTARAPIARPSAPGPSAERPLLFGEGHSVFGILTPADPGLARSDRPVLVVTNAGCVNRQGPHRMFTKLARRWARLGFDVLRVDLPGIGDTPVQPGVQENVTYPPSARGDLAAAIKALGNRRAIVVGLCSGGDYAFQLGARGANVAGAWMLNPRTFCVLDLVAVESGVPPSGSVEDVPRALSEMASRGVDTLLVVSRNDPGVAYVDKHAGEAMRSLETVRGFKRVDLDGADHPFTPISVQERVGDLLTEQLAAYR